MSGKKAKALRKIVYGNDFSFRTRNYKIGSNGASVSTGKRREYQSLKKIIRCTP